MPTSIMKRDADATQIFYKTLRGILNKLTCQKFAILTQQILDLQIDTEERLNGCVNILHEMAVSVPLFSVAYANVAKRLILLSVQKEQDPSEKVNFRTLLLNKCQREFENNELLNMVPMYYQRIAETYSGERKKQGIEDLANTAVKLNRRSVGNIRFIGELFKLKMLTESIIHECLGKLCRAENDHSLECLCQLLTCVGQELDNKQSKLQPRMDMYFKDIDALLIQKEHSSRIRLMILDIINLRKNNWLPIRRAETVAGPPDHWRHDRT